MQLQVIQQKIYAIRGQKVMLDFDLAELYEVETRALNQAVKRNIDIFPGDFMFQLSRTEWENMSSQIVTTYPVKRPKTALPLAFTEHGVINRGSILVLLEGYCFSVFYVIFTLNIIRNDKFIYRWES